MDIEESRKLLRAVGVFYDSDEDEGESQTLNMNDTWGWACAWGEHVPDEELPEVARLFWAYGWPGVLYWTSERHDKMTSEFYDINRMVEFVRNEERIRAEHPGASDRAYFKTSYEIRGERTPDA